MALSINPVDLLKVWREERYNERQSFLGWIDAVQRELKKFIAVWMEIQGEVALAEVGKNPFEGWPDAKIKKIEGMFFSQTRAFAYLDQFYHWATLAAGGRGEDSSIVHSLSAKLSGVLSLREDTRYFVKKYAQRWGVNQKYFYLNDENYEQSTETVKQSIDNLIREAIALDVLIETVKANPKMFQ